MPAPRPEVPSGRHIYPMAPLIRLTLLGLYLCLVVPLAPLAPAPLATGLLLAALAGLILVLAITSERVALSAEGIEVGHPPWCSWVLRRGWSLPWGAVHSLTPVATSQGGRVYYVRAPSLQAAYLLPQRVARFEEFLAAFSSLSGVDTRGIARISPPWTYRLLAVLVLVMLLAEVVALGARPWLTAGLLAMPTPA